MGSKPTSTINSCVTLGRSLNLPELFLSHCTSGFGVGVGDPCHRKWEGNKLSRTYEAISRLSLCSGSRGRSSSATSLRMVLVAWAFSPYPDSQHLPSIGSIWLWTNKGSVVRPDPIFLDSLLALSPLPVAIPMLPCVAMPKTVSIHR